MAKFYLFSKESCGPCMLVDKYMRSIKDERTSLLEKVDLEDVSDTPIPQENLDLAKRYGVTATPVLIITDDKGNKLEEFVGGMGITQNIRKMFNQYVESKSTL
jgi:thioredoxin-related protein